MKKIIALLGCFVILTSCVNETQINNPAFQTKLNNVEWRSKETTVKIGTNGGFEITAIRGNETIFMKTSSRNIGTYILGTTNQEDFASYTIQGLASNRQTFSTDLFPGPVFSTRKLTPGNGYVNSDTALTTGGSGSGLVYRITVNNIGGVATDTIKARGYDYFAGDIVTIEGGNNNATFRVLNVQQSNGEIVIENTENNTITGKFKINMVDENGEVVTFSQGIFYKIPLN
ncbi:MAG: hypothetical protein HC854_16365 [Flavobacterium sp.]|nr:hypothetical protein [Flavobacterium sp.]